MLKRFIDKLPWFEIGNYRISILLFIIFFLLILGIIFILFLIIKSRQKREESKEIVPKLEVEEFIKKEEAKIIAEKEETKSAEEMQVLKEVIAPVKFEKFLKEIKTELETKFIRLILSNLSLNEIDWEAKLSNKIVMECNEIIEKLSLLEKEDRSVQFSVDYYKAKNIFYATTQKFDLLKNSIEESILKYPGEEVFKIQKASLYIYENKLDDAENILKNLLESGTANINVYSMLIEIYVKKNELEKALELVNKVILIDPYNSKVYAYKGLILFKKGLISEAEDNLKKSLSIKFNDPLPYYFWAEIYFNLKYYEKAYNYYKKAINFGYTKNEIILKSLISLFHLKKYNEIIKQLEKQQKSSELNIKEFCLLLASYIYSGEKDEAIKLYDKFINKFNEDDISKILTDSFSEPFVLGEIYYYKKNYEKALNYYKMLLNTEQAKSDIFYKIGYCYYKLKNYSEALNYFEKAEQLGYIDENLFINLGFIYAQNNNIKSAINAYKKAINLNNFNYQSHNNLGVLYAKIKKYDLALEEFKLALKLNPNEIQTIENIKRLYKLLAESPSEEFITYMEKVL